MFFSFTFLSLSSSLGLFISPVLGELFLGLWWFALYFHLLLLLCSLLSLFQLLPPHPHSLSSLTPLLARSCSLNTWDSLLSKSPRHFWGDPWSPCLHWEGSPRPGLHPARTGRQPHQPEAAECQKHIWVCLWESDTSAGRWYYFGEHFYVQFRVHILRTARTEIISLMCVCTIIWSSFRWEQIYTPKSKGNSRSRLLLHSLTINGHAMESCQPNSPLLLFLPRKCLSLKEN